MANRKSTNNVDSGQIERNIYSDAAGAQKNAEVGRHLVPIAYNNAGTIAYTTDCSTARALPSKGRNIAVFNNAGAVGSITLSDDGVPALAAGATDASGNVGIPCGAGEWTYIACNEKRFVKASAATLLVFLIEDDSSK